jgi:queuine tRNA-ribosyltransferase
MSYIHHLFRTNELLGLELASKHNLTFYLWLMEQVRHKINEGTYHHWYPSMIDAVESRI